MRMLLANAFSIVCVVVAGVMMYLNRDGWGWLLALAALGLHTYEWGKRDA